MLRQRRRVQNPLQGGRRSLRPVAIFEGWTVENRPARHHQGRGYAGPSARAVHQQAHGNGALLLRAEGWIVTLWACGRLDRRLWVTPGYLSLAITRRVA